MVAEGGDLAKRVPKTLPSIEEAAFGSAPAHSVPHAVHPNQNLAGFQQATARAEGEATAVPDRRRPIAASPEAQPPSQPVPQPANVTPPAEAGFGSVKRVPGASSLSQKTAARDPRREQPATAPGAAPTVAARFGANLAGFQRGVQKAGTESTEQISEAQPTANHGEMS